MDGLGEHHTYHTYQRCLSPKEEEQEATRGSWHRYERSVRKLRTGLLAVLL